MKIRTRFVSNSSSSSFIINVPISVVANSMIDTVISDNKEYDNNTFSSFNKLCIKCKKTLQEELDRGGKSVIMPSCNYETFIHEKNGICFVETSNNHSWDIDDFGYQNTDDGQIKNIQKDILFFDTRTGTYHYPSSWERDVQVSCPNKDCGNYKRSNFMATYHDKNGNLYCDSCHSKLPGVKV